jgi:hypothetical protein
MKSGKDSINVRKIGELVLSITSCFNNMVTLNFSTRMSLLLYYIKLQFGMVWI